MAPERVIEIGQRLRDSGVSRVALADTTGMANPLQLSRLVRRFREEVPGIEVAVHFHNTRGAGLANVLAALQEGVDIVASLRGRPRRVPVRPGSHRKRLHRGRGAHA